jgi:porin
MKKSGLNTRTSFKKNIMNSLLLTTLLTTLFCFFNANASTSKPTPASTTKSEKTKSTRPVISDQPPSPAAISSNPAAVNVDTGTGTAQRYIEKKLGIQNNHGIEIQGAWLGDVNQLFSGGIPDAQDTTGNSIFLLNMEVNTEKLNKWKGGLFGAQFLQVNTQNTNGQVGTIQGYNSLPGSPPLVRSELYELWFRQAFFDDKLYVRVGKTVTTLDFNNVIKPDSLRAGTPTIPAVTSLIYTPIFTNTSMLGVIPGFYNSAYGVTLNFTPTKEWYFSYGIYDGNSARGVQTGLTGPTFNGSYFQIGELGAAWLLGKNQMPGNIGVGLWHQTGLILQPPRSENGASGAYAFGSQRIWYRHPGYDSSGVSAFYQYGVNNSSALPMKQFIGAGLTAFDLVPNRPDDSFGVGTAVSWLNQKSFARQSELMYQVYYQAKVIQNIYLEPALSYIPNPGASPSLSAAWAGTLRAIVLF